MRRRFLAAVLAAVLLCLCACQLLEPSDVPEPVEEDPSPTQTAQPARGPEPNPFALAWNPEDTLDPLRAGSPNQTLVPLVFQGLFALDDSFEVENVLCQSYVQAEDGLSWTFTLRDGVVFSDGTPLTADTAAACLNEARACVLYGARLEGVARITAGEGTVTVQLSAPNGALPALLDVPIFLYPTREEGALPLGTGPYYFDNGDGDGELCLRRSPTWRGTRMPLEEIPLRPTASADDRIATFDTGAVTLADTDLTGTGALGYSCSYETWDYPTSAMLYLGFNTQHGACRDGTLRQAVLWGMDRESLTRSQLAGHADPAVLPVSPHCALYDQTLAGELSNTREDAALLLEEGGYGLNEEGLLTWRNAPVSLTLLVNSENTFRTGAAEYLANELRALGITVTVSKLTWDDFLTALEEGAFDLYLAQVKLTADFDLSVLLEGELNYGGFDSEELPGLLEQFRIASGDARRRAASALYAQLAVEAPFAPLCFTRGSVLTQWGTVSGLNPTQNDPFYAMERWSFNPQ